MHRRSSVTLAVMMMLVSLETTNQDFSRVDTAMTEEISKLLTSQGCLWTVFLFPKSTFSLFIWPLFLSSTHLSQMVLDCGMDYDDETGMNHKCNSQERFTKRREASGGSSDHSGGATNTPAMHSPQKLVAFPEERHHLLHLLKLIFN